MMRAPVEGLPEVALGGRPLERGALVRVELWLAADRPDRLELIAAPSGLDTAPGAADGAPSWPAPGTTISVSTACQAPGAYPIGSSETTLFDGIVLRHRLEWSAAGGALLRVVAFAGYHRLRDRARDRVFLHATDSEMATAIASSLELVAVVDRTRPVHAVRKVTEDPLSFLRKRARDVGYELAVAGQRLYFVADPPWEETIRLSGTVDVLEARVTTSGGCDGRRGGQLSVVGRPHCLPLRAIVLSDLDRRVDGTYRIVRALHRWEPGAHRVTLDILESGLDMEAWSRARSLHWQAETGRDRHAF